MPGVCPLLDPAASRREAPRRAAWGDAARTRRAAPLPAVLVVGSPRSGTTFLAPPAPWFRRPADVASRRRSPSSSACRCRRRPLRAVPWGVARRRPRRLGAGRRKTPEMAYLVDAAMAAFPQARVIHLVRDGRDVAAPCSSGDGSVPGQTGGADDAGLVRRRAALLGRAQRREEFVAASEVDATRLGLGVADVSAARSAATPPFELRYVGVRQDPEATAEQLAAYLDTPGGLLAVALREVHTSSIGRYRSGPRRRAARRRGRRGGCAAARARLPLAHPEGHLRRGRRDPRRERRAGEDLDAVRITQVPLEVHEDARAHGTDFSDAPGRRRRRVREAGHVQESESRAFLCRRRCR